MGNGQVVEGTNNKQEEVTEVPVEWTVAEEAIEAVAVEAADVEVVVEENVLEQYLQEVLVNS